MSTPPTLRLFQVVLDSADHRAHAEFYRNILGGQYLPGSEPGQDKEPEYIEVRQADTNVGLAFQVTDDFQAPDWPDHDLAHTQAHVDMRVDESQLDVSVDFAVSLGARVLSTDQHNEGLVVLADPAGHPFCIIAVGHG